MYQKTQSNFRTSLMDAIKFYIGIEMIIAIVVATLLATVFLIGSQAYEFKKIESEDDARYFAEILPDELSEDDLRLLHSEMNASINRDSLSNHN